MAYLARDGRTSFVAHSLRREAGRHTLEKLVARHPESAEDLKRLAEIDPTPNHDWLMGLWGWRQVGSSLDDIQEAAQSLANTNLARLRLVWPRGQRPSPATWRSAADALRWLEQDAEGGNDKRLRAERAQTTTLVETAQGKVLRLENKEAACTLGAGSSWCSANWDSNFYKDNQTLYGSPAYYVQTADGQRYLARVRNSKIVSLVDWEDNHVEDRASAQTAVALLAQAGLIPQSPDALAYPEGARQEELWDALRASGLHRDDVPATFRTWLRRFGSYETHLVSAIAYVEAGLVDPDDAFRYYDMGLTPALYKQHRYVINEYWPEGIPPTSEVRAALAPGVTAFFSLFVETDPDDGVRSIRTQVSGAEQPSAAIELSCEGAADGFPGALFYDTRAEDVVRALLIDAAFKKQSADEEFFPHVDLDVDLGQTLPPKVPQPEVLLLEDVTETVVRPTATWAVEGGYLTWGTVYGLEKGQPKVEESGRFDLSELERSAQRALRRAAHQAVSAWNLDAEREGTFQFNVDAPSLASSRVARAAGRTAQTQAQSASEEVVITTKDVRVLSPHVIETLTFAGARALHGNACGDRAQIWCTGDTASYFQDYARPEAGLRRFVVVLNPTRRDTLPGGEVTVPWADTDVYATSVRGQSLWSLRDAQDERVRSVQRMEEITTLLQEAGVPLDFNTPESVYRPELQGQSFEDIVRMMESYGVTRRDLELDDLGEVYVWGRSKIHQAIRRFREAFFSAAESSFSQTSNAVDLTRNPEVYDRHADIIDSVRERVEAERSIPKHWPTFDAWRFWRDLPSLLALPAGRLEKFIATPDFLELLYPTKTSKETGSASMLVATDAPVERTMEVIRKFGVRHAHKLLSLLFAVPIEDLDRFVKLAYDQVTTIRGASVYGPPRRSAAEVRAWIPLLEQLKFYSEPTNWKNDNMWRVAELVLRAEGHPAQRVRLVRRLYQKRAEVTLPKGLNAAADRLRDADRVTLPLVQEVLGELGVDAKLGRPRPESELPRRRAQTDEDADWMDDEDLRESINGAAIHVEYVANQVTDDAVDFWREASRNQKVEMVNEAASYGASGTRDAYEAQRLQELLKAGHLNHIIEEVDELIEMRVRGTEEMAEFDVLSDSVVETVNFDAARLLHGTYAPKECRQVWCTGKQSYHFEHYQGGGHRYVVYPNGPTRTLSIGRDEIPWAKNAYAVSVPRHGPVNVNDNKNRYLGNPGMNKEELRLVQEKLRAVGVKVNIVKEDDTRWSKLQQTSEEMWRDAGVTDAATALSWDAETFWEGLYDRQGVVQAIVKLELNPNTARERIQAIQETLVAADVRWESDSWSILLAQSAARIRQLGPAADLADASRQAARARGDGGRLSWMPLFIQLIGTGLSAAKIETILRDLASEPVRAANGERFVKEYFVRQAAAFKALQQRNEHVEIARFALDYALAPMEQAQRHFLYWQKNKEAIDGVRKSWGVTWLGLNIRPEDDPSKFWRLAWRIGKAVEAHKKEWTPDNNGKRTPEDLDGGAFDYQGLKARAEALNTLWAKKGSQGPFIEIEPKGPPRPGSFGGPPRQAKRRKAQTDSDANSLMPRFVVLSDSVVETVNFAAACALHGNEAPSDRRTVWCTGKEPGYFAKYRRSGRRFVVFPDGPSTWVEIEGQRVPWAANGYAISASPGYVNVNDKHNNYWGDPGMKMQEAARAVQKLTAAGVKIDVDLGKALRDAEKWEGLSIPREEWIDHGGVENPNDARLWENTAAFRYFTDPDADHLDRHNRLRTFLYLVGYALEEDLSPGQVDARLEAVRPYLDRLTPDNVAEFIKSARPERLEAVLDVVGPDLLSAPATPTSNRRPTKIVEQLLATEMSPRQIASVHAKALTLFNDAEERWVDVGQIPYKSLRNVLNKLRDTPELHEVVMRAAQGVYSGRQHSHCIWWGKVNETTSAGLKQWFKSYAKVESVVLPEVLNFEAQVLGKSARAVPQIPWLHFAEDPVVTLRKMRRVVSAGKDWPSESNNVLFVVARTKGPAAAFDLVVKRMEDMGVDMKLGKPRPGSFPAPRQAGRAGQQKRARRTAAPMPAMSEQALAPAVAKVAAETGVHAELLEAVIAQESGRRPGAVSPKGAEGLGQIRDIALKEIGSKRPARDDIEGQVRAMARYLLLLFDQFEDLDLVLAAYNAGPTAVRKHNGVPPFSETRAYVTAVKNDYFKRLSRKGIAVPPP